MEVLQLDVTDSESIARCAKEIGIKTGGTLDYLVNNAGFGEHFCFALYLAGQTD